MDHFGEPYCRMMCNCKVEKVSRMSVSVVLLFNVRVMNFRLNVRRSNRYLQYICLHIICSLLRMDLGFNPGILGTENSYWGSALPSLANYKNTCNNSNFVNSHLRRTRQHSLIYQKTGLKLSYIQYKIYVQWKVESSRPNLRETRDKRPLSRDPDRSWCHRHTTSMIKLYWSQPMAPWASAAA